MANSHCQTQHLLHLELDGGLHFINFGRRVLTVGQQGRELARLVQAWAQDSWDLLDQRLRSQKGIILLGQLLDQFLILVEFPQCHVGDIHSLGFFTALLVPQNTHGEFGAGSGLKPDGAQEMFVLLRVIGLQADLKHHHLQTLQALMLVPRQDFPHRFIVCVAGDFTPHGSSRCDNWKSKNIQVFDVALIFPFWGKRDFFKQ